MNLKSSLAFGLLLCCIATFGQGPISAVTSDGRKVILNDDGTWKFVYEAEGKKVVLNPDGTWKYADSTAVNGSTATLPAIGAATVVGVSVASPGNTNSASGSVPPVGLVDSTTVAPVDSVKEVIPPPKPKPPLNLNCSALVDVTKDLSGEQYVALSKTFVGSEDPKAGFKMSLRKTKKSPVTWTTTLTQPGQCLNEQSSVLIVFQNGGRIKIDNDAKANCKGEFIMLFGGEEGKEEIFDMLKSSNISGMHITGAKGGYDLPFDEDTMLKFKAAVGCMPKLK